MIPKPELHESATLRAVTIAERTIQSAIEAGASDVHFQSISRGLVVRFRVDGVLEDYDLVSDDLGRRIVNHLKVLAEMNVADRRRPQDGRLFYEHAGRFVDLRVATVDSLYGENLTLRVLDRANAHRGLADLGLESAEQSLVQDLIRHPHGLVLVTGPTGAGKTTSLYALLEELNDSGRNLVTVEEPIEYDVDRVNQIAVDRRLGLGFAECLRAVFRHDPDVIMVGEIRDPESADIAVRAALSGHLVLSSLHSGSAISAYTTLVQFGVPPFMAASALLGVVTQQLVRKNCPGCQESIPLVDSMPLPFDRALLDGVVANGSTPKLAAGRGCAGCRSTGFSGRAGIFEILTVSPEIREALAARTSRKRLETLARAGGWRPLLEAGFSRIARGATTWEEVQRVAPAPVDFDLAHDWTPPIEHA
ncbi:MAG: GspE/PulE family protein [Planctomycetota bacterium]